jgi:hypothetical protein
MSAYGAKWNKKHASSRAFSKCYGVEVQTINHHNPSSNSEPWPTPTQSISS